MNAVLIILAHVCMSYTSSDVCSLYSTPLSSYSLLCIASILLSVPCLPSMSNKIEHTV